MRAVMMPNVTGLRLALALIGAVVMTPVLMHSARAANWADDTDASSAEFAASKAICARVKKFALPQPDAAQQSAKDCDATALYYGIGQPADPAAARSCALRYRATGDDNTRDLRNGPGILATIYANGLGVTRDYDLAIRYACEIDGAPAEMDGRVRHLAGLKATGPGAEPFDVCQDITSGAMEGYCAEIGADITDAKREAAIIALTEGWTPDRKAALAKLRKAADAFIGAVTDNEVDVSGTGRGQFIIDAQQKHRDQFAALLREVATNRLAGETPSAFAAADKALNLAYGKVMKTKDASVWGTVTKHGIVLTQKAWLVYRDAFAAFLKTTAPTLSLDRLETALTLQRIADLKAFGDA